jgi:hypothetical protein
MLALSSSFIAFLGSFKPMPISSRVQKDKFWAEKVHSKKKYQVIIAGDSRVYRGVDPKSLSEQIGGLSALNFGFSSGGFNDVMFSEITSKLLNESSRKIVVLGITPYSVTPKAQENEHFVQEKMRNPREVLARRYVNPALSFFEPIQPMAFFQDTDTISGYHETFKKDGWVASYKLPLNPEGALEPYKKNFEGNRVEQEVLKNLYRQIMAWRDAGIIVYAFRVPSTYAMETLENSLSGFDEEDIRKGVKAAGGHWIEILNKQQYDSYDGSHLTESSAMALSRYLGKHISDNLKL